MSAALYCGDALDVLKTLPDGVARCCVTSPPYWGLRDYGVTGQLGLERTPEEYVASMVAVFAEVRRVLADDGTLWLNLGDSYAGSGRGPAGNLGARHDERNLWKANGGSASGNVPEGLKPKDLVGIPWRVAFALQADGWWLRSDIIWAKPNPMPESVTDRPTKAHEYLFLLSKSERYFYDASAIRTEMLDPNDDRKARSRDGQKSLPNSERNGIRPRRSDKQRGHGRRHTGFNDRWDAMSRTEQTANGANARTVWTIPTSPYPEAHFATFPEELARRCILAGTSARGGCPQCGAAWVRVVEREAVAVRPNFDRKRGALPKSAVPGQSAQMSRAGNATTETLGWRPTCNCHLPNRIDATPWTPDPDVVLDPFGGSGTVAQVATGNGRASIYIDLNPKYLDLARKRIGPLLCESAALGISSGVRDAAPPKEG